LRVRRGVVKPLRSPPFTLTAAHTRRSQRGSARRKALHPFRCDVGLRGGSRGGRASCPTRPDLSRIPTVPWCDTGRRRACGWAPRVLREATRPEVSGSGNLGADGGWCWQWLLHRTKRGRTGVALRQLGRILVSVVALDHRGVRASTEQTQASAELEREIAEFIREVIDPDLLSVDRQAALPCAAAGGSFGGDDAAGDEGVDQLSAAGQLGSRQFASDRGERGVVQLPHLA